jgi:hypothetical protein
MAFHKRHSAMQSAPGRSIALAKENIPALRCTLHFATLEEKNNLKTQEKMCESICFETRLCLMKKIVLYIYMNFISKLSSSTGGQQFN